MIDGVEGALQHRGRYGGADTPGRRAGQDFNPDRVWRRGRIATILRLLPLLERLDEVIEYPSGVGPG